MARRAESRAQNSELQSRSAKQRQWNLRSWIRWLLRCEILLRLSGIRPRCLLHELMHITSSEIPQSVLDVHGEGKEATGQLTRQHNAIWKCSSKRSQRADVPAQWRVQSQEARWIRNVLVWGHPEEAGSNAAGCHSFPRVCPSRTNSLGCLVGTCTAGSRCRPATRTFIAKALDQTVFRWWVISSYIFNLVWWLSLLTGHALIEIFVNESGISLFEEIQQAGFSKCLYTTSQIAIAYHNKRDVDKAIEIFQQIIAMDPYRLENLDMYSNLLFVREQKTEMAHLAHKAVEINKYRPETCCVIGNYYSIRSEHQKAILYFQRALKLNPKYLSAWTLMGHEFMELKNTNAAIQSYRQAVEVNRRDFRAWLVGGFDLFEIF